MIKNLEELNKLIEENGTLRFKIKVVANSKVNLIDFCDEYIKVKIMERALEGRANKAIIQFLSQQLKIQKSSITIAAGEKSSVKIIQIKK